MFAKDEHNRPDTTVEGLKKLPKVFKKDGVVHAGAACGICDGAGSMVMATRTLRGEARPQAPGPAGQLGHRRVRPEGDGHRPGAGHPPAARARRSASWPTWTSSR